MRLLKNRFGTIKLLKLADWLMLALVMTLPWSTGATSFLSALWLIAFLPTLRWPMVLVEIKRPRSALPLALFALFVLASLWSMGSWQDSLREIKSLVKLTVLPLVVLHVSLRPQLAKHALQAFLSGVVLLMATSWVVLIFKIPRSPFFAMIAPGIPVKDWISQSFFFLLAAFIFLHLALDKFRSRSWKFFAIYIFLIALFLLNLLTVHPSRTTLFVMPAMVMLFALQRFGLKRGLGLGALFAIFASGVFWLASPEVRHRVTSAFHEVESYTASGEANSAGYRLEWYKQSVPLIAASPFIGYGTGGTHAALNRAADTGRFPRQFVTQNPHNQFFWTALQTGLIGAAILLAMWAVQVVACCNPSLAGRIGVGLMAEIVIGSLFNSHLADFTQGWAYVIGIGIAMAAASTTPATQTSAANG